MLTWTSALLLAAPLFLLAYALTHRGRTNENVPLRTNDNVPWRTILLVYLVCSLAPLLFALLWRIDATRIVIELHAIAFRTEGSRPIRKDVRERRAGSGRVVIGDRGEPAQSSRRFGGLAFTPAATGDTKGKLTIDLPPPEQRAGLISTRSQGFLGALALEDGDRICVAGSCWAFDADDRAFTIGKRTTRIPPRVAEVPGTDLALTLPFAKPIAAGLRTWSLDWLAHDAGAVTAERRVRSFFCHTRSSPHLQLVTLDADVTLIRAGAPVTANSRFDIADGDGISFYSLPSEGEGFAARGVTERRSVVYRAGSRAFVLDLDTPEVHSLRVSELDALRVASETKKKVVALAMGDAQLVDRSLYFSGLSESVAVESSALIELSRFFPRDFVSSFRIVSPRGPMQGSLGAIEWIGANDAAAIRLDVRRPPLLLLVVGLLLLALKVIAAAASRLTLTQLLMAGAIEALIGIRLLFGYRTWAMPPHKTEAIELAVVAWLALPWIYLVASMPLPDLKNRRRDGWRGLTAWMPAVAGLLFSMLLTARLVEGKTKWVWIACHLLALVVAALRFEPLQQRIKGWKTPALLPRSEASGVRKVRDGARWLNERMGGDRGMNAIVFAAIAFTVVRAFLLLFGFKESANIGARISLSVLHIPAAALLQGMFFVRSWRRVRANGDLARPDILAALAILLFVWLLPAGLTSDIGLALLNVPVFALLFLALTRHAAARKTKGRWLARVLVAGIVIVLAGAPLFRLALPLISSEETLLEAASDSNYARFFHFAAPEQLRELATKRGESLAITSALLQAYISSGLFGRGFGHTEVSSHLGDTALRDFAPAVFVAAEWGLVGTVAALLLYLAFAIIAQPWLPWQTSEEPRTAPVAAFLAAATISVSSIYMILANHELLLLTGKNAYLLGLDSAGDVIEVIVLVLLIAYGGAVAATRRERSFGGSL